MYDNCIMSMKILSITAQKPHSTGSGTYLTELVSAFARRGARQAVVAGVYEDDDVRLPEGADFFPVYYTHAENDRAGGVQLIPEGYEPPKIGFPVLGMSDIMPYEATRYRDLTGEMEAEFENAFAAAVRAAADRLDPDIVICHHLYLLTALVREILPERRVFGICHGSDLRQFRSCELERERIKDGIGKLDGAFALHAEQARVISGLFGMPQNRIAVIGSGYNSSIFNDFGRVDRTGDPAKDGPVRIVYAGKLSREKGLFPLFEALGDLARRPGFPEFELRLAGGCRDCDIASFITGGTERELEPGPFSTDLFSGEYLGMLSQEDLADVFRRSDVFVLPSYYEGLPLVLIEAMACGLLTVCTDLPGIRDWVETEVPGSSVIFVRAPRMAHPGVPLAEDIPAFRDALENAAAEAILYTAENGRPAAADTSSVTWDGAAAKIMSVSGLD
jgi:glycogen(starch) synthase